MIYDDETDDKNCSRRSWGPRYLLCKKSRAVMYVNILNRSWWDLVKCVFWETTDCNDHNIHQMMEIVIVRRSDCVGYRFCQFTGFILVIFPICTFILCWSCSIYLVMSGRKLEQPWTAYSYLPPFNQLTSSHIRSDHNVDRNPYHGPHWNLQRFLYFHFIDNNANMLLFCDTEHVLLHWK